MMSLFICPSDVFLNEFISSAKKSKILETQYILISSQIIKTGKFKNVISIQKLIPPHSALCKFKEDSKEDAIKIFREHFDANKGLIATIINSIFENDYDVFLLCSKKEWTNLGYLKELSKYIEDTFGYPVYNVKKVLNGASCQKEFNEEKCKKIVKKVINNIKKNKIREGMSTVQGRKNILKEMSKSDMVKKLKKMGIYSKNMSKKEIKETLEQLFINI